MSYVEQKFRRRNPDIHSRWRWEMSRVVAVAILMVAVGLAGTASGELLSNEERLVLLRSILESLSH